jgi:hypothetical protein
MAKWDIKDGFWRLDGQDGEEWNFAYVLRQPPSEPVQIVVPTSLQMGWVKSPPYFCAATEMSRDIATQYCNTALGSLQEHKFDKHVLGDITLDVLPSDGEVQQEMRYLIKVCRRFYGTGHPDYKKGGHTRWTGSHAWNMMSSLKMMTIQMTPYLKRS